VNLSARADYAVRSMLVLAAVTDGRPLRGAAIAAAQNMPPKYVEQILVDLRRAGLVMSQRGSEGGFRLARPAREITIADVLRATEGPLAGVRGLRPEELDYEGDAAALRDVWLAVRVSLRSVVEHVTLDQVVLGKLPARIARLANDPEATETRPTRPGVRAPGRAHR
jgi:Rrf2 family protein